MDKIYSRNRRIHLPNLNNLKGISYNNNFKGSKRKISIIGFIVIIAIITAEYIIHAISPIMDKQCLYKAKIIATKVSNEQASLAMTKYKYDDLCVVTKDSNRKYCNDKCKCSRNKRNSIRCDYKNSRGLK